MAESFDASDEDHPEASRRLPIEIYEHILHFIDLIESGNDDEPYGIRESTLIAVAASCRLLQPLAEYILYANPPELKSVRQRECFYHAITIQSRRASLVQSLSAHFVSRGADTELLICIARACPNIRQLDILRGLGDKDEAGITRQDADDLAELLGSCPNVNSVNHHTWMDWEVNDAAEEGREVINGEIMSDTFYSALQDSRFIDAAAGLTELRVSGQSTWVLDALAPHLTSKLTTLSLGQDIFISDDFLRGLSSQSPALQNLRVSSCTALAGDVLAACKVWASNLRKLDISRLRDEQAEDHPFPVDFPTMPNLVDISLRCDMSIEAINALGQSGPPQRLQSVEFFNPEEPDDSADPEAAQTLLETTVCSLIRRHSTTLETLSLGAYTKVGQDVVGCCEEAPALTTLWAVHSCVLGPHHRQKRHMTHFPPRCD